MLTVRTILQRDEAYSNYRSPGTVITKTGTVLTYFEARRTAGDWAMMDILLCRSEDGGKTFSAPLTMAAGSDEFPTVNNPVCIVGNDGILHFIYCRNYSVGGGDVFCRRSSDDGRTWSEPVNIMASTMPEYHNAFAAGPCHGICKTDGTLLVPVWMVPKAAGESLTSHHPAVVSTLYSRDNGETWQLGEIIPPTDDCPDPNETQAAELSDGRIWLNCRCTGLGCRAVTVSDTGWNDWAPLQKEIRMTDPTCCGSVTTARYSGRHILLTVNCDHAKKRENLTCRASLDDGKTWPYALVVEPGDAGYADIAAAPDGKVYVLYEQSYGLRENWAEFTLDDLLGAENQHAQCE